MAGTTKQLTRYQKRFYDLYLENYGSVILWTKNGKTRILDPNEIEIIRKEKNAPKKKGLVERFLGK